MARVANESAERVAPGAAIPIAPPARAEVPVMAGTHFHALDEKGRVIIPAKLRPALTEQFWMMLDENDNVGLYNYKTGLLVLEHCEQMMAQHAADDVVASAVERITGSAELMVVENGWRVPIPEILRFWAQLDKEVVTVGVLNHAVLWSRDKWEAGQARRLQSGDVRRAQAGLMRAAASATKRVQETADASKRGQTEEVVTIESATWGADGSGVQLAGRRHGSPVSAGAASHEPAVASAGYGGRSSRVLTLSNLGR